MKSESLLRLAISMDTQAATTLDKYVCRLVENVLLENTPTDMTSQELAEAIENMYGLQFDLTEINRAIKRRARKQVIEIQGKYALSPQRKASLAKKPDAKTLLFSFVEQYKQSANVDIETEKLYQIITQYLYYCFNSNIKNLIPLLRQEATQVTTDTFSASDQEIRFLNGFISWDNIEKNKALYTIVSFSYEYCMLTAKKDTMLSSKLFKGKRFILDSNLIFRMAGINKDERRFVIRNFTDKCCEVGIELLYTSETLSEVYRVIDSNLECIEKVNRGHEPISKDVLLKLEGDGELTDFYHLFLEWCNTPGNSWDDYLSFQQYVYGLIQDVISTLTYIDLSWFLMEMNQESFESKWKDLQSFKQKRRPQKRVSNQSAKTDVSHMFYTLSLRNKSEQKDLWHVHEYFVSADQLLIAWANEDFSGVPIVVIPSVWLSIILRFSGRSEDDYRSYCSFLNLRQHEQIEEYPFKPIKLLNTISHKTIEKDLKEKIVFEIIRNKNDYRFNTDTDYDESTDKAFDKVAHGMQEEYAVQSRQVAKEHEEQISTARTSESEQTIIRISSEKAYRKVDFFQKLDVLSNMLFVLAIIIWILSALLFASNTDLIHQFLPSAFEDFAAQWDFIKWIGIGLGGITAALGKFISTMGSDNRRVRLYRKYYNENRRANQFANPTE